MSFKKPNYSVPVATTKGNTTSGNFYSVDETQAYFADENEKLKSYTTLAADQKPTVASSEAVSIRGMVSTPVATNFEDSKKSMNELAGKKGDLAKLNEKENIDICPFLSGIPDLNIPPASFKPFGLPSADEIMSAINGVTLLALKFPSDILTGVFGAAGDFVSDLAADLQGSIPTITCGKPSKTPAEEREELLQEQAEKIAMGSGFDTAEAQEVDLSVPDPTYGTKPNIVIDSPDVTVQSLSDELDAGEF